MKCLKKRKEPIGVWRPSKYKPVKVRWRRVPIIPVEEPPSQEDGQLWLFEDKEDDG